ncbi:SRPBCC family protein [Arthrobacter gandavensis]|uniref:SRPBCC family protein n=1 Tax=Arthrobacter gandavensis TaxID=169960 RepID=UPI00188F0F06|nr:SRPBCC family protein [Arthrobacter gandavensis]MBF4992695.1 SRPBCC family protein [Arthrobacter gandavensis]
MRWTRRPAGATAFAAAAAGAFIAVRRASLRWGATEEELGMALPGDELLPAADLTATRAIGIGAPPSAVWPWLTQLGQNRGGFYTYDWLENLIGLHIHSADAVTPELQVRGVGEAVDLAPGAGLVVVRLEDEHGLVLGGGVDAAGNGHTTTDETGAPYDFTWAFVLLPQPDGTTRLVVRERYAYRSRWAALLVEPVEMLSFLMTERMLRGIRDRAESGRPH